MSEKTSDIPVLDMSTSTTGCCPKFDPSQWDGKMFEFRNKPFMRDRTVSFMHIPLNMGKVMARMQKKAEEHNATAEDFILLSQEISPWHADHFYAVTKDIDGADMVHFSGQYYSKVYEGEFKDAGKWHQDLIDTVAKQNKEVKELYFYYTTCPKCAKTYGKNYVVGLAKIA
jgi:hypothetical protein